MNPETVVFDADTESDRGELSTGKTIYIHLSVAQISIYKMRALQTMIEVLSHDTTITKTNHGTKIGVSSDSLLGGATTPTLALWKILYWIGH